MDEVGGYEAMVNRFKPAASTNSYLINSQYNNLSCGFPPDDAFHIFRDLDSAYPWPGLTFGLTLLATYFFCTNQVQFHFSNFFLFPFAQQHSEKSSETVLLTTLQIIVQRNLAAKNVSHSKAACVLTSYLKILPFFLFTWPGMISRILFPGS